MSEVVAVRIGRIGEGGKRIRYAHLECCRAGIEERVAGGYLQAEVLRGIGGNAVACGNGERVCAGRAGCGPSLKIMPIEGHAAGKRALNTERGRGNANGGQWQGAEEVLLNREGAGAGDDRS